MDSDNKSEDDRDPVSSQILDYYKKYSQSRQLPKYFSGASVAYLPEIVKSDEVAEITGEVTLTETVVERTATEQAEARLVSPASSVTSNRKLEWDNGADIGYGNYKDVSLHKSISLPILSGLEAKIEAVPNLVISKLSDSNPSDENLSHQESSTSQGAKKISSLTSEPKLTYSKSSLSSSPQLINLKSSSSSGPQLTNSKSSLSSGPQLINSKSSSSSGSQLTQSKSSSSNFDNTLAYLKSKIGTPDAESTPKLDLNYVETPVATNINKVPRKLDENCKKIVNLCVTNPVTLECVDRGQLGNNKKIQTSVVENLTKSVQTGDSLEKSSGKVVAGVCNQPSRDKEDNKSTSNSNLQTDSDVVASHCDSFEFSYGGNYDGKKNGNSLKRSKVESDLASSSASSKTQTLAHLIVSNQSNSLINDIDKSIELLQKLMKSKKYDSATKKRYVKKIVSKIVNSKYIGDSSSSSEWFVPKIPQEEVASNSQLVPENLQDDGQVQQKLQDNLPWYPAQIDPSRQLTIKTFSSDYLPHNSNHNKENKKKSIFTITTPEGTASTDRSSPSIVQRLTSSSNGWKNDKTLSERVLEAKKGQGDQLVKFAMKERCNQIAWINDEISHLSKLKTLLERSLGCKGRQQFQEIQKTTTVYMMSHNYDKTSTKSDSCESNGRKYVIETELESSSTSEQMDFNFRDKDGQMNYRVREVGGKSVGDWSKRKIVGDIEVVSDDKTTNIRVKAKKLEKGGGCSCGTEFKPKQPSLVGSGTYPGSNQDSEGHNADGAASKRSNAADRRTAAITKKVADILERYTSKSDTVSSAGTDKQPYQCKACITKNICRCKQTTSQTLVPKIWNEGIQCKIGGRNRDNASQSQSQKTSDECLQCKIGCSCQNRATQAEVPKITNKSVQCKVGCSCQHGAQFSSSKTSYQNVQCKTDCNCKDLASKDQELKGFTEPTSQRGVFKVGHENIHCQSGCKCKEFSVQTELSKPKIVKTSTTQSMMAKSCHESIHCQSGCKCKESSVQTELPKPESVKDSVTQPGIPKICSENIQCQTDCKCKDGTTQSECLGTHNGSVQGSRDSSGYTQETYDSRRRPVSGSSEDSSISSTSSSSDFRTLPSGSESYQSCSCCKRKNSALYSLRKKLSDQTYPLCRPCYQQRSQFSPEVYSNPGHICNCYTVVQTKTLNEIKKTINDLNELDHYCTCANTKRNRNSGDCCRYCKYKLKKTSKDKHGIAYMLTFEDVSVKEAEKKKSKRKKPALEEIKIKIPVLHKKKKDKENRRRREDAADNSAGCSKELKAKPTRTYTLQEHLHQNRPDFVEVAEERRKTVADSRSQRQEGAEKKKMLIFENNLDNNYQSSKRLFSSKEMKEITRKNYQKLPEVQKKLVDQKEGQIRQANRLIVDTFNRKMKENVLKGKINLPTNVNIVNL